MPPKKRKGRTTTRGRAKPVFVDITNLPEEDQRRYRERQEFLRDNFKQTVMKQFKDEIELEHKKQLLKLQESYEQSKKQLEPYAHVTMAELFEKQNEEIPVAGSSAVAPVAPEGPVIAAVTEDEAPSDPAPPEQPRPDPAAPRMSLVSALVAQKQAFDEVPTVGKKKGRKKKEATPSVALSAPRVGRHLLPPANAPATANPLRSRKMHATPLNQRAAAHMMVTPKFDPRLPLPAGTVARAQRADEVAISLRGSPLQAKTGAELKAMLEKFVDSNLPKDSKMASQLKSAVPGFVKNV